MDIQPIRFTESPAGATRELVARFTAAREEDPALEALRGPIAMLDTLDRQYGAAAPIELEETEELIASILTELSRSPANAELVIGVALWAIRHAVPLEPVEPVVNALAQRSNEAATASELTAVYGLMQGVIAHVSPRLAADLERSNPERAWRLLHVNFAITAVRTEDPRLLDFAFDALDAALPDECAGFYAEALALALAPGIAPAVRERIEARHIKWTGLP
jgi:hypothetical protein